MTQPHAAAIGLHDHARFLRAYPPYDALDGAEVQELVRRLDIAYLPAGHTLDLGGLVVIRRGELDLGGELYGSGDTLGGGVRTGLARATVDSWLYVLSPEAAEEWLRHPALQSFLLTGLSQRLEPLSQRSTLGGEVQLSDLPVTQLLRPALTVNFSDPVQEVAAHMGQQGSSSALIPLDGGSYGIVTDRDLRDRVLAAGRALDTPVGEVMSAPAVVATHDMSALSALAQMLRRGVQHLPVVQRSEAGRGGAQGGGLLGMVSAAELLRAQAQGLAHLTQDLSDAADETVLSALGRQIPQRAAQAFVRGQRAHAVARLASHAYGALMRRAWALAQAQLGPPPGPYAWLVLGSVARREPALVPDQDHVLLIESGAHQPYFAALSAEAERLLDAAGLSRCAGGIMASHQTYTREAYVARMEAWFRHPSPQAMLDTTIYFDPRVLDGTLDVREVRATRLSAADHPQFMGHLIRAATASRPPLGFLQRIRTGPGDTLDLKAQGLALIVDLARIHGLYVREPHPSTAVRLGAAGPSPLTERARSDLLSAYLYLLDLRLAGQVRDLEAGRPPGHQLSLHGLSGPQEVHLREIFKLIERVQGALAQEVGGA